ncbi:MAG TPA: hypothetical protein VME40_09305 [Caulobacteraceae bacterium]|nr:hypothetical protein [Caulobacteraceae bacterium]
MSYSTIQPPFTLKFGEMSALELTRYRTWFLEVKPERIRELNNEICKEVKWESNYSRDSIEQLGVWISHHVETRPREVEDITLIKGRTAFNFDASANELTNRTFSIAVDAGMYFGEALIRQHHRLKWEQSLKSKRFADFGQMVLVGFSQQGILNPVRIVVNFCYGVASGQHKASRFIEVYGYWSRLADEADLR